MKEKDEREATSRTLERNTGNNVLLLWHGAFSTLATCPSWLILFLSATHLQWSWQQSGSQGLLRSRCRGGRHEPEFFQCQFEVASGRAGPRSQHEIRVGRIQPARGPSPETEAEHQGRTARQHHRRLRLCKRKTVYVCARFQTAVRALYRCGSICVRRVSIY